MLLLIDYSSMLYRAYHSMPSSVPMNGVHGFLNNLARMIQERGPQQLALGIDVDWRPEFRVNALPMYKLQRVSEEVDPVLEQEALGREILEALGFAVVGAAGYEAEDVIATLAENARGPVEILSGDRDTFDLVRDPHIKVLYPSKGGLEEVTESWIQAKYGIPGRSYGEFALLRGDPSDGLPGVAGIGEKTAARLMAEHGSLDALLAATNLPLALRKKLFAAKDYLEAARRVVLPVRNLELRKVSLELPKAVKNAALLAAVEEEHRLGSALTRVRSALGIA